jgi:transglutaminase-like putative cysteine protease
VPFILFDPVGQLPWLLATGAAFLLLLGFADQLGRMPTRLSLIAWPVIAIATAGGLVTSTMIPDAPGWGSIAYFLEGLQVQRAQDDPTIRVDDLMAVPETRDLIRVQGEVVGPLKLASYTTFTGREWVATNEEGDDYDDGTWVGDPETPAWTPIPPYKVEILRLTGRTLPTSVGPHTLKAEDLPVRYSPANDAFFIEGELMEGISYEVEAMRLDRTKLREVSLDQIGALAPPDWSTITIRQPTKVRELTLTVIGNAPTQHQMLLAIQYYLEGPEFGYTLKPSWTDRSDPVWAFLTAKQGYCIHFATAMAVMAASIGIPARVAVGFKPGPVDGDGWRRSGGLQAHMWPEFFYPGIGWVAYDPAPALLDATSPPPPTPDPTPTPIETVDPDPEPDRTPIPLPVVLSAAGGGFGLASLVGLLVWRATFTPTRTWQLLLRAGSRRGWFPQGASVREAVDWCAPRVDASLGGRLLGFRDYLELAWYAPVALRPEPMAAAEARRLWWEATRRVARHWRREKSRRSTTVG